MDVVLICVDLQLNIVKSIQYFCLFMDLLWFVLICNTSCFILVHFNYHTWSCSCFDSFLNELVLCDAIL
jgi:hypothetical protein